MANLNNTFKITVTNKNGSTEDAILTGPITFSIVSSSNSNSDYCFFRIREYSNDYNMESLSLAKEGSKIIKNFNRETMDRITVSFLTVSDDYRDIFDKGLNDIEELSFEYSNNIGSQDFTDDYNSFIDFTIKYSINN